MSRSLGQRPNDPAAGRLGRDFMTVWFGQAVSGIGSTVSGVGIAVWVFVETGSAAWLGVLAALGALPALALMPVLARLDRWRPRRVMIAGDLVAAAAAATVLGLGWLGQIQPWHLGVAATVTGAGEALRHPAFQRSIPILVEAGSLDRANGLNQFGPALGITVGPIIAAPLVAWWGLGAVMVIDLATFAVAVAATLAVGFDQRGPRHVTDDDGSWSPALSWLAGPGRRLAALVAVMAAVNLVLAGLSVAILALAVEVAGEKWAGVPLAIGGLAMVVGSLLVGVRGLAKDRTRVLAGSLATIALGCAATAASPRLGVVAGGLALAMVTVPRASAAAATIFQERVPESIHGRVFAISGAAGQALAPVGSLATGVIISAVAVPAMAVDGWAGSTVGRVIGSGAERAPALVVAVCGLALAGLAVPALVTRADRSVPASDQSEPTRCRH